MNNVKTSKQYLLPFIVIAIAASLSSCNSNSNVRNIDSEIPTSPTTSNEQLPSPTASQIPTVAQLRAKSPNPEFSPENKSVSTSQATTKKTTNITLYTSDSQCQQLIPQKVAVSADEPVKNAVEKILDKQDTSDLSLSGYRVSVKNSIATVDFRISSESKRQIASLSSCEQFALFGSLRKTLMSNAQWKIKQVRFTERGEEIVR